MFTDVLDTDHFRTWEKLLEDLSKRSDDDREEILLDCDPELLLKGNDQLDRDNLFFGMGIAFEQAYRKLPIRIVAGESSGNFSIFTFTPASGERVFFFGTSSIPFAKKLACRLYNLPV